MKRILVYGDSNTWGFIPLKATRYPEDIRWTGRLQMALGEDFRIIEEGLNGRTTNLDDPDMPDRNGLPYLAPCLLTHQPLDLLIIALGTNDLKEKFGREAADIADGVRSLLRVVETTTYAREPRQVQVLIIAPALLGQGIAESENSPDFTAHSDRVCRELGQALRELANEGGHEFIDLAELGEITGPDLVHFTEEGHRRIADLILNSLSSMRVQDA